MDRGPEGAVTIEWEGFEGTRQRARYWEERSERWSLTGRTDASARRWSMLVIFTQPVAIRRAAFCRVWILLREEGFALGNQMGQA